MKNKSINLLSKISIVFVALLIILIPLWLANASSDPAKGNAILSVSSNDVTVSLMSVNASNSQVESEVCIDLPDNGDWLPYAHLEVKGKQIPVETVALMNAKNPDTYKNSYRCYELSFPSGVSDDATEIKVVIEKLHISMPEFLSEEMCIEAEKKIQNTYPEFSFSCEIGKQGVGFTVSSKPQEMTEEQANQLIVEALTSTTEGPWELTYNVK